MTQPPHTPPGSQPLVVPDPLDRAAWSWVAHLLAGGTTTWAAWVERPEDAQGPVVGPGARPPGAPVAGLSALPGAAQLELLRRLNAAAGGPVPPDLARRVLRRPAPGRGAVDLPLGWPGEGQVTADGFHHRSAPPTDPGALDVEEVLRVASGVVADQLLDGPVPPPARRPRRPRRPRRVRRPRWGPQVWVEGPPRSAEALRAELVATGARLHRGRLAWRGGRTTPDRVLVVVPPVERTLFEVWAERSLSGAARRWEVWVQELRGSGDLPPTLRAVRLARYWAETVGPDRVEIHVRDDEPRGPGGGLSPLGVDVVRRVNAVLLLHRDEAERAHLSEVLADRLRRVPPPVGTLGPRELHVPPGQCGWVDSLARRIVEGLTSAGYPVHGDLASLRPRPPAPGDASSLDPWEVLSLMAALLLPGPGAGDGR